MSEHYDRALGALSRARQLLEKGTMTHEGRQALLGALDKVAQELAALEQERRDEVEPIAALTESVAARAEKAGEARVQADEDDDVAASMRGAVASWEATHPRLVQGLDELLMALRQMGI